jgi:hypothetical protein
MFAHLTIHVQFRQFVMAKIIVRSANVRQDWKAVLMKDANALNATQIPIVQLITFARINIA